MIPVGSQVIIVEANEPGDLVPASVTWQLVGTQEPGSEKKVSRCSKTSGWVWVGETRPWHGATICILEAIIVATPQVCLRVWHHAVGFQWHLADPAMNYHHPGVFTNLLLLAAATESKFLVRREMKSLPRHTGRLRSRHQSGL